MKTKNIIFDFGGVLIDWNPRYFYRKYFNGDEEKMEWFLNNICTLEWNLKMDAGLPFDEGVAMLVEKHPEHKEAIVAYSECWQEMLGGEITETVNILKKLKQTNIPLYGLTNWSGETFPVALELFDFLSLFDGIVVSGIEKVAKPDKQIYELILSRYNLVPEETVFIDDNVNNIKAAKTLGIDAIWFENPENLKKDLKSRGFEFL